MTKIYLFSLDQVDQANAVCESSFVDSVTIAPNGMISLVAHEPVYHPMGRQEAAGEIRIVCCSPQFGADGHNLEIEAPDGVLAHQVVDGKVLVAIKHDKPARRRKM